MDQETIDSLKAALDACLQDELAGHLAQLVTTARAGTPEQRDSVLALLMQHARFAEAAEFADACPQDEWAVVKRGSQAQVELGRLTAALERLAGFQPSEPSESDEIHGRRGRIYKQLYLDAKPTRREPRQADLELALEHYGRAFDGGSPTSPRWGEASAPYWLGVNCLALLHHGASLARDGARQDALLQRRDALFPAVYDAADRARQREQDPCGTLWALLTLAEVCLAGARHDEAIEHVRSAQRHVEDHPGIVFVFQLGAFERQLVELWGLSPDDAVLVPIRAMKARSTGGAWPLGHDEAILGREMAQRYDVLSRLFHRARGVARIEMRLGHTAIGSAFAVSRTLLLTCRHVATVARPRALVATFTQNLDEHGRPRQIPIERVVWKGNPKGDRSFDACLLELCEPLPSDEDWLPLATDYLEPADMVHVYALGHPGGADLHVSLHDSAVLAWNDHVIQYRTPTVRGSSGGAILDENWNAIGVHTSGGSLLHAKTHTPVQANECIRIDELWPEIVHEVERSRARDTPLQSTIPAPATSTPVTTPSTRTETTMSPTTATPLHIEAVRLNRARWIALAPSTDTATGISQLLVLESAPPIVVAEKRRFEFTFDLQGTDPQLIYTLPSGERVMRSANDVIINHTTFPGSVAGEEPYFFLRISGRARGTGQHLVIAGEYRQGDQTYSFGPGQLGDDVLVAIPSLMTAAKPVQYFTFDLTAAPQGGPTFTYDPLCVMVPVAGSVVVAG